MIMIGGIKDVKTTVIIGMTLDPTGLIIWFFGLGLLVVDFGTYIKNEYHRA